MGKNYKAKILRTEEDKFQEAIQAIASMADEVEDVYAVLVRLARITDEEWRWILGAKKTITSGVCALCASAFQTERRTDLDTCNTCRNLYTSDAYELNDHRLRAKHANLPDTLTLPEWLATKKHFQNKCAYCLQVDYECLDHFIPICKGGGTVASNCVPSCRACNWKKGRLHPDKITKISKSDIERVRTYLNTLKIAS